MYRVPQDAPVYLYTGTLDMRVGFDRLVIKIAEESSRRVISGGYYASFSGCLDTEYRGCNAIHRFRRGGGGTMTVWYPTPPNVCIPAIT